MNEQDMREQLAVNEATGALFVELGGGGGGGSVGVYVPPDPFTRRRRFTDPFTRPVRTPPVVFDRIA